MAESTVADRHHHARDAGSHRHVGLATALSRALPSLNFPRPAITDGTDAVRPAQLRGLAPDQVLVLVNGKRRHTTALINLNGSQGRGSSPVDLNAIPIAAIERVEVLRDGASAQYGSDAIAGVVNIVLKGSDRAAASRPSYGAGERRRRRADPVSAATAASGSATTGFIHLAGAGRAQEQTDRARPLTPAGHAAADDPASTPQGQVVQRYGDPEIEPGRGVAQREHRDFNDDLTALCLRHGQQPRRAVERVLPPRRRRRNDPTIYPERVPAADPQLSKDRSIVARHPRHRRPSWNCDASYNYGYNYLTFDIENSLNRSLGPTSQTDFYAGALEVDAERVQLRHQQAASTSAPASTR